MAPRTAGTEMRVLDLFSGIGGIALGLHRAGMQTVGFCEIDPYCRRVLAKNFPGVWIHDDVRTLTGELVGERCGGVDIIAGGFPCQDISLAGNGAGLDGERSGLWREFYRLIEAIRPEWAFIENVPALRSRGLETILGTLAAIGFDAEWHCIPAAAFGAPHRRDRLWIVAHAARIQSGRQEQRAVGERTGASGESELVPDADCRSGASGCESAGRSSRADLVRVCSRPILGNADGARLAIREGERSNARQEFTPIERAGWWLTEPAVGRVAHGVSGRVDRLRGLGNAVVPQVVEYIGRRIMAANGR